MKGTAALKARLDRVEEQRQSTEKKLQERKNLDELEQIMEQAAEAYECQEAQARREELALQWREFEKAFPRDCEAAQREKAAYEYRRQLAFWEWQVSRGYITGEELGKLAGHENAVTNSLRELRAWREFGYIYDGFPDYDGGEDWGNAPFAKPRPEVLKKYFGGDSVEQFRE